jgi:hypothetical protein
MLLSRKIFEILGGTCKGMVQMFVIVLPESRIYRGLPLASIINVTNINKTRQRFHDATISA